MTTPVHVEGQPDNWLILAEDLKDEPPTEWFVDKLFPYGGVSLIFGPPNVGKSLLALDLSLRVAKGKNFAGRETRSGPVLYVATEGARPALRDRLEAWRQLNNDHSAIHNVAFWTRDINILAPEGEEGSLEFVIEKAREEGIDPELIIIDTLNFAFNGDENSNKEMGDVAKRLMGLRTEEYSPTVVLVHHTPKSDKFSARGASALEGAIDASLNLQEAGAKKLVKAINIKNRYASKGAEWYYSIRDDDDGYVDLGATVEYTQSKEAEKKIAENSETQSSDLRTEITALLAMGPMRAVELKTSLPEYGEKLVEKMIATLKREGTIAKQGQGRTDPYVLVQEKWRNRE